MNNIEELKSWFEDDKLYVGEYVKHKIDQLDEPEKVVVPEIVADYIQEGHELGVDLGTAMTIETEMLKHIRDYIKNNEETFARAWLDGYEVEKEPSKIKPDYYRVGEEGLISNKKSGDLVNHPSHYQGLKGLEVREVMENFVPKYGQYGGLVSCDIKDAIKYILRAPDKNGLEDLQKAQRMIKYAIDSLAMTAYE